MTHLRVMLTQLPVRVGDIAGNASAIAAAAQRAAAAGVDVLITPEMAVTGYPCEDLLAEPGFVSAAQAATATLAADVTRTVAIVGSPWRADQLPAAGGARAEAWAADAAPRSLRNAALVLHDGAVVAAHAKSLLPTYSVFDDARHFGAGVRDQALYRVETVDGPVVFAVLVCEDAWDTTMVAEVAAAGAQVVLVANASPYHVGKPALRLAQLRAAAATAGVPVAYVNAVGGQDELVFDGGSLVVDADGRVLARGAAFAADELVVDIPAAPARPALRTVVDLGAAAPHRPLVEAARVADELDVDAEVYRALVTGFGDYCRRSGVPRVVLGLSGGIDSALAATIAVDALGADNVWGIGMPGPYSSAGSVDDARELAENLGIRFDVVQITDPYLERHAVLDALVGEVAGARGRTPDPVAWENLQARLRGATLMTVSNAVGALVITTGNRSESAVGYFTLYGDSCGAINPLGDLLKTTITLADGTVLPGVYGLSQWRNEVALAAGQVAPIPAVDADQAGLGRAGAGPAGQRLAAAVRGARPAAGRVPGGPRRRAGARGGSRRGRLDVAVRGDDGQPGPGPGRPQRVQASPGRPAGQGLPPLVRAGPAHAGGQPLVARERGRAGRRGAAGHRRRVSVRRRAGRRGQPWSGVGPGGHDERLHRGLVQAERGDGSGVAVRLEEREQDVPGVDAVVVEPHGLAERELQRLLGSRVERDEVGNGGDGGREPGGEGGPGVVGGRGLRGDRAGGDVVRRGEQTQRQVRGGDLRVAGRVRGVLRSHDDVAGGVGEPAEALAACPAHRGPWRRTASARPAWSRPCWRRSRSRRRRSGGPGRRSGR